MTTLAWYDRAGGEYLSVPRFTQGFSHHIDSAGNTIYSGNLLQHNAQDNVFVMIVEDMAPCRGDEA